jgi:CHAD domain-containing protein
MAMELERAQEPLGKLRKSLKRLPNKLRPNEVHRLRTQARRIESIAAALALSGKKETRRLLESIKPIREAAGGVRDMDVLTGTALGLPEEFHDESLGRLVEYLKSARKDSLKGLFHVLGHQRHAARHRLKQYLKLFGAKASRKTSASSAARVTYSELHVRSVATGLMRELGDWPTFNELSIHPFRLKVKELRTILQLLPNFDPGLLDALGAVKDQIGDWHDWQQLAEAAGQALKPRQDRALLAQIKLMGKLKLGQALASSNALRKRYFNSDTKSLPAF